MKRLILLALIGFLHPNFSYANTPNTCGSNIKDGIVICYDLKSYNKNPKISLEFGNGLEEEKEDYSNDEWKIKYNLKANLSYKVVVKQNNKISFTQNYNSMDYLDTEYDVYYSILQTNNTAQSDLISYKIHPKNFYPQYSTQLSQIIKTYKNLDENNFEIKKSEYIVNTLKPLLQPEKLQLKKIEDKRNSILGDDFNNYINSLKEKDNENKQSNVQKIVDQAEKVKQEEQEVNTQIEELTSHLDEVKNATIEYNTISQEQRNLEKTANNQNDLSKMFNNVSGKNSKRANQWDELEKQKEESLLILKKYGNENDIETNIKNLKDKKSTLNESYEFLQENIKNEENKQDDSLYNNNSDCMIVRTSQEETSILLSNNEEENIIVTKHYYNHIKECYEKFINDKNKLEMLYNIDNLYIKQHKKVQFIIDTIENIKKKIESDKMKKDLEKELS
jgi:hypothetical protein